MGMLLPARAVIQDHLRQVYPRKYTQSGRLFLAKSFNEGVTRVIFFKGCSRCRGDMHVNQDIYGTYVQCIQCGRIKELGTSAKHQEHKR
jgi:hypothetical protein